MCADAGESQRTFLSEWVLLVLVVAACDIVACLSLRKPNTQISLIRIREVAIDWELQDECFSAVVPE